MTGRKGSGFYHRAAGDRPLPTSLRSATFPMGEGYGERGRSMPLKWKAWFPTGVAGQNDPGTRFG